MLKLQSQIKQFIRKRFNTLAIVLDRRFGKAITPAGITWTGFVAHLPIAYLIAHNDLIIAGLLLILFGLFDTLDGALARVQKKASPKGMFLDASTDRLKEVILYTGFTVLFIRLDLDWAAVASTLACGLSLSVSYVKAKGEAALASLETKIDHQTLNRIFDDGIGSFETRIALLVIGCLAGTPEWAIVVIIALTLTTVVTRFNKIMKAL